MFYTETDLNERNNMGLLIRNLSTLWVRRAGEETAKERGVSGGGGGGGGGETG